ncbi:MAG: LemA family protein [Nitrospirae bacterium]|nr:LemA family protein [Nitrospirota bacterium]
MKKGCLVFIGILVLLIIIGGSWFISGYNRVVILDEEVNKQWAQIDVVLQRRYDLIPNLVNTVKGYAAHEKGLFTEVTRLRSQWAAAGSRDDKIKAARGMEGAISKLLLVTENYPDLKASENFLSLQAQLEGTENRIAVQRMRYNEAARNFNAYIRTFFGGFFARIRGLTKPVPYFEIENKAKEVPKVDFTS